MKKIQAEVDNINEIVKSDVNKAYTPFINLYTYCKENNQLDKLAQFEINLINSHRVHNVEIQFKALILMTSLYEGKNNYIFFKTKLFLGRLYSRLDQFHKAFESFKIALNYFRSINDIIRVINCYSCIGKLYRKVNHLEESSKYFHIGLDLLKIEKNNITEEMYLKQFKVFTSNIALTYYLSENYNQTERYILQSLKIKEKESLTTSIFQDLNLLAYINIKLNKPKNVLHFINRMLQLKDIEKTMFFPALMSTIGDYHILLGDNKKAAQFYKKATKQGEQILSRSTSSYAEIIDNGLTLAIKRNKIKDIIWYSEEMQKVKNILEQETQYYSDISFKQLDQISELENEKKQLKEISYILVHDLKTPIRIIKNMAEIVLQEPETIEELLPKIIINSKNALELINATLEYSKLTLNINPFKKISLNDVLKNVINNLALDITQKKAKIKVSDLPSIYGNYTLINQLFSNLIYNALYFNKKNPIIEITNTSINKNLVIQIKDNGIGIPEKDTNKIFKLFKKSSIQNNNQGTGVGLAICQKIVEMHKGIIYVKSEINEGSIFYIEIPMY